VMLSPQNEEQPVLGVGESLAGCVELASFAKLYELIGINKKGL